MKRNLTISIPMIPVGEPYEKVIPMKDRDTGLDKNVPIQVMRAILIPDNKQTSADRIQSIELTCRGGKSESVKKSALDVMKTYIKNEERFAEGKSYLQAEIYCGPRVGKDSGDVNYLIPSLNDYSVVDATEEDQELINLALSKDDQAPG